MRHRGYRSRTFLGLNGPLTIRRARFQCGKTGKLSFPLDELLDLPGGQTTVSLARRTMRLGTRLAFAELQEEMLEQHDVRLTDSTLDTLMQKVGGVAEADRQKQLDALAAQPRGHYREQLVKVEHPTPARLYISCDGITYRTRYREEDPENPGEKRVIYQEMKAGAVFWEDAKGKWQKQVVTGRDDPERFGLSLWKVAVECGLLDCPDVVFISDGGTWCSTVAESYFKDATRILDWYHLSEHVWAAAKKLYPQDEKAASRWAHNCLDHLYESGGRKLMAHLQRCRSARRQAEAAEGLQELVDYVSGRLDFTEYSVFKEEDYVIGSGMMESTCKQVVGQRLKGPGMQWSEEGAIAMAALVGKRVNGTWNSFWESRPLQRAA
jgi:hypothetical protein